MADSEPDGVRPSVHQPSNPSRRRKGRHRAKHAKRRRSQKFLLVAIVLVSVLVLAVAGGAGYTWYLNHQVTRIDVKGLTVAPTKGVDLGTENILLVGSTSRCALTVQATVYGLCSQGVDGVNSDVVMILHLNPSIPSVSILSIPRDLFVPNARAEGAYKIDAALYEGPTQLVAAVEEDFGIPIQHYVELNFDGFGNVVNALGGINMYFPEPVFDSYSDLDVTTTGCHFLNGWQALQVVRARHLQYQPPGDTDPDPHDWPQEAQSDLARIQRDHEFLRVMATAVAKRGLSNPITDEQLLSGIVGQLTVDNGFSLSDMVDAVLTYHDVSIYNAPQLTIPVEVDQVGNYYYDGSSYGDVEFPIQPDDQQTTDQFLGVSPTTDTMNGGQLPSPDAVTVSVLNGTGDYNQAATTSAALGQLGFDIVGTGDTPAVGAQSETLVTYSQMTPADEAAAQAVAHSISGAVIMHYGPTTDGADVTVTTGSDFTVDAPAASTTPATTAPVGGSPTTSIPSTTTTTTAPSDGAFSAPTSAVEPLAPWDPRSCTATGGEGP
ncbi:MAG: LCP family protein [Acidimicrobiales bacterium]|jgi:LCP family protein required for cell wall assembly